MEQLSFQSLPVLGWLFESTIYISILICLIFIIKTLTKKKLPAWWGYCLWLFLLARMLIPFGVETPVSVYNYVPAPPENSSYMPYLVQYKINIPFIQNAPPPPDFSPNAVPVEADLSDRPLTEQHDAHKSATTAAYTSGFDLSLDRALLLFWLAGVLAFGIATIYKNCKFWLIIRREKPITDKDILDLFNECRSTLGLQKNVEIIVTDSVKSPAIFGYVKPQLLLPPHFLDTLNKDELYCIFMHEMGHVKRHDIGVSWLATLFQVIYWFNPLLWYAFHHLRADQEAACDAYVLSKIKQVQPTDYARTIVNLLQRFVQNRQLPSLAGIIENKSQIDRRISMILDYKKITQKVTIVSVLMLLLVVGIFFACSNGRLSNKDSSVANISQSENPDMKHYKSDDWNFSLGIPGDWVTSPSLPAYLANEGELIRFGSNDDGLETLRIFMYPCDPELSLNEERDRLEKQLIDKDYGNFSSTETKIGSRKALKLDYDKEVEGVTLHAHTYLVPYESIICLLNFTTTRPDPTFEFYDRIAKTFEYHETSVAHGTKRYVSPNGNITMEIPANWNTMPEDISNDELVRFGTLENGLTAIINNPVYISGESLEGFRAWIQGTGAESGWKDFTNSETVINGRRTLILDCSYGSLSSHVYFFEDGDYKYRVAFFASQKNGIPADRLKVYERVIKSIVIRKKPKVAGFKEYVGPDLKKPTASGTKRYISPEGDYTVDVPGDWYPYTRGDIKYGAVSCGFATSKNGLTVAIDPRTYSPWLSLEERRDGQEKVNTDAGWKILGKSETVINGRKTLMLDSSTGTINIRHYLFKDGDYIYSSLFYAFNTDGIPADRIEGYERVVKSINIIKVNPKVTGMKEYTGPDIKKPIASGMKRYISPDSQYTVDVPGDWRSYAQGNEYGETYLFGTSENGLAAIFYPPAYSPGLTLEGRRGNQVKVNTDSGWSILGKSETVINGRKTLILDSSTGTVNIRNYLFKDGDYIYSSLFYAFNTDGIPADRVAGYEKVMKSINIINAGLDSEKSTNSGITGAGALPVQFRLGQNKPGRDLEEMTASGSDRKVYLHKESVLSNADIKTAVAMKTKDGFGIDVRLTEAGGKKLAQITKDNVGKVLGIVVDGKLINAPVIRAQITGGKGFISGKFTLEEAKRVARGIVGAK